MIEFQNVYKSYNKGKPVLDDISFDIREHEFCALIGNNGCGKTTTINIICNLIDYNSGGVFVYDRKVTPNYISYKNKLGVVLSEHHFVPEFKLTEYWKFVAKFQAVSKKNIKQRIEDLISLLDLNDELDKPIKNLSSGNQTKVIFGAAILHNPEILILDEPFTNLDIDTSEKLLSVLKSVAKKKTIFITSHNLDMVADLCDRFLIMDKGKIAIELRKSDFETAELLKMHVKELLINKDRNTNISWLNS